MRPYPSMIWRMFQRAVRRVDSLSRLLVFLVVAVPLLALYLATATTHLPYQIDALTNALSAWDITARHSVYFNDKPELAESASFGNIAWFVQTPRGDIVSQYPPGAALFAAPFYLFDTSTTESSLRGDNDPAAPSVTMQFPSLVPASTAAALATAVAVGLLVLVFFDYVRPSVAIAGGFVAGLGTGAWSVASDALWQHGPAMLWLALAFLLTSKHRYTWAGLAFGLAILTRPPLAIVAAAVGLAAWLGTKSIRSLVAIGTGSGLGLGAVVVYNWAVFGTPSVSGGYGSVFTETAIHSSLGWYLRNLLGALVDPEHGLLIWAPFLLVLIPGLVKAWRAAPPWARGGALGGLLYLLVQLKANRFSGGGGHFAYRYPLEALTAAAPLLLLSWRDWVRGIPLARRLFAGGVTLAIVGQIVGSLF